MFSFLSFYLGAVLLLLLYNTVPFVTERDNQGNLKVDLKIVTMFQRRFFYKLRNTRNQMKSGINA